MRYLPLVPNDTDPQSWVGHRDFDLLWMGPPHGAWARQVRSGVAVHALHFPTASWGGELIEEVATALSTRLNPDFLVLGLGKLEGRQATARFFNTLKALLEATHSRGVKLALRPAPGTAQATAGLLKEMRGEAVGFCWDAESMEGLEAVSDRLFCAVGREGADLAPLLHLGYRWNLALAAATPESFAAQKAAFESRFTPVLFPAELPTHALGRLVVPDEGVTFGQGFGGGRGA